MFRGTFTALVTPFRNGDVDFAAFEKLVEAQIAAGITGLVAIGTTGESPTLTHEEKEKVIQRAVKIANGRCKLLAGTGTNSTRDAMLYNIPGRCSVDIGPDTVVRLAESCRNIVSIKEASGSVERVGELRRRLPKEFTILSGDDSLTLPFIAVGAVGVVSVASNLFPAEICALVRACESGDFKSAENLHRKMFSLFKDLFIEPNPVPAKTALAWRGAMSAEVRLPLCEMTEANQTRLRKTLEAFEKAK